MTARYYLVMVLCSVCIHACYTHTDGLWWQCTVNPDWKSICFTHCDTSLKVSEQMWVTQSHDALQKQMIITNATSQAKWNHTAFEQNRQRLTLTLQVITKYYFIRLCGHISCSQMSRKVLYGF